MTTLSDRLDADRYAEAWRPETGDQLIGRIVALDRRVSAYDDRPYPIITIEVDTEESTEAGKPIQQGTERAWHAWDMVAQNKLRDARPVIGDRIAARSKGMPEGKRYRDWAVIVERPDGKPVSFDWDAVGEPELVETGDSPDKVGAASGAGDGDDDIPF